MKVLILGLGQYPKGSGISAALFFARAGDDVLIVDQKNESELAQNVRRLKKFHTVRFHFGKHRLADIRWADVIVRNPRVRPDSREMKYAARLGTPIVSDVSLFLERCPAMVIGVTGTRGKSTTSTLIAEMLKVSGRRVWLGGNILVSPLTFLSKVKGTDIVVLELSSWQLEVTGALGISPHIACITNLMRDHLNTYHSMEEYAEAKAQIFRHQSPHDILILNGDDRSGRAWMREAPSRVIFFTSKTPLPTFLLAGGVKEGVGGGLRGEHNRMNARAASITAKAAGASDAAIRKALKSFRGLPHRQEVIAIKRGVIFVNDTTATTPDGTIAALKAFAAPRRSTLRLILGGADKELEFDELARELRRSPTDVVVLPGTAHQKLTASLRRHHVAYQDVTQLKQAITLLYARARSGDIILLSPGCASFGLFHTEFERGNLFQRIVRSV